jgi:GDP-L-fucose synthase
MEKRYLITGGAGLVGTSVPFGLKPTRKEVDLSNYSQLIGYIRDHKITDIVHCAGKVGGVKSNKQFINDFLVDNLTINANIIKASREVNRATFLLSTCIFPEFAHYPLTEEQIHNGEPHSTNYGYAYAKRMLEVGARSLREQYKVDAKCIIPCNLYGANDNYDMENGHVLPSLIHRCYLSKINNQPFTIWGEGKALREFVFSEDLGRILQMIHVDERSTPDMMIVSPGKEWSIREVVEIIISEMGFSGELVFDKTKPEGIIRKPTNNILFTTYFPDFKFTDLKTGLKKTIEDFLAKYPNVRK